MMSEWNSTFPDYDNATQSIFPILTVHMPVANVDREGEFYGKANSSLLCVRAKDISPGSRIPPALEVGVPWVVRESSGGLGDGVKGGIAAGAVVVALVAVGVAAWWFLRKRSQRRRQVAGSLSNGVGSDGEAKTLFESDSGNGT